MSQPTKQLAVRLPLDLHAKLVAEAANNNRSGHAEMLHRLAASFEQPAPAGGTGGYGTELGTVLTTCFNRLEERVMAALEHPMRNIVSLTIPDFGEGVAADELKDAFLKNFREKLHQGHAAFDPAEGPGTQSPTGRLSESQPELQSLPVPEDEGWIENTGTEPEGLTDQSVIDFKLAKGAQVHGHRYLQGDSKGRSIWGRVSSTGNHVSHWRFTKAEPAPDGVWIENTGRCPDNLDPEKLIETKTRPHGCTHKRMVGDIPGCWWGPSASALPLISHWRIAQ